MGKLVVKIRDDDKNFPHCPLHHEGYCHLPQTHYQKGNALYMAQCLGTINKRPPWCPLKEEKEAILIEWIKDYVGSGVSDDIFQRNRRFVLNMIKDWEEENG